MNTKTQFKIAHRLNKNGSEVETVMQCRSFLREEETLFIYKSVCKTKHDICKRVSKIMECDLRCKLSGSFAENTKCFAQDEFDFMFQYYFGAKWSEYFSISQKIYSSIDSIIRFENHGTENESKKLKIMSLLHKDKISSQHSHVVEGPLF